MAHRSVAAQAEARAAGPEEADGSKTAGDPAAAAALGAASAAAHLPAGALRWPASALFRWEDQGGSLDVWDYLSFPPRGHGMLGRLLSAVTSSKLFRGRERIPTLLLIARLSPAGSDPMSLPLYDDEDVEKAVSLWRMCPGVPGVITIAVNEEGERDAAPALLGEAGAPPSRPRIGGGPWPSRPAPFAAFLGNALPVDMWACVFNAVASSRCVEGACPPLSRVSIPPLLSFGRCTVAPFLSIYPLSHYIRHPPPAQGRRRAGLRVRQRRRGLPGGALAPRCKSQA